MTGMSQKHISYVQENRTEQNTYTAVSAPLKKLCIMLCRFHLACSWPTLLCEDDDGHVTLEQRGAIQLYEACAVKNAQTNFMVTVQNLTRLPDI